MKTIIVIALFVFTLSGLHSQTFYDFKVETLEGDVFDFSSLKGKKVMVVNTASKCGNTPQYADLEKMYNEYKSKGLIIIGFPANDFAMQEPGSNEQIREFCTVNYGVTFPIMAKISVKGENMAPIYEWLTQKSKNGVLDSEVKWNFQKYLIDEKGTLVNVVEPKEKPYSPTVLNWLNQ